MRPRSICCRPSAWYSSFLDRQLCAELNNAGTPEIDEIGAAIAIATKGYAHQF
jgi:hypothetical protein